MAFFELTSSYMKSKLTILIIIFISFIHNDIFSQNTHDLKKEAEIQRLRSDNYPVSEIFVGFDMNTNFGIIENTSNTINLETTRVQLDNIIPSFNIGFKYLLNPERHHGLFIGFKRFSKRALTLSNDNDYAPAFDTSFNELKIGVVYGRLTFGYGQILDDQTVTSTLTIDDEVITSTSNYKLSSLGLTYTIIRSNRLDNPSDIRDYWSLDTGVNYLTDFEDLNYMSLSVSLKYHFSFNRPLDLKDKIWLEKRSFE